MYVCFFFLCVCVCMCVRVYIHVMVVLFIFDSACSGVASISLLFAPKGASS